MKHEQSPVFKSWAGWYWLVVFVLLGVGIGLYFLTEHFS
jgi:hypothetical protein